MSGDGVRTFLLAVLLLIVVALGGLVGAYYWFSCPLPPTGVVAMPEPADIPASDKNADGSVNWRARTLIDLAAAQKLIWDNTPVPYDNENPQYREWAVSGFAAARVRADRVTDLAGYFYTVAAYINGFHDPHFQFSLAGDQPAARWPGFIAARKGDLAEVVDRDPADGGAPPVGATIVSCEGRALTELLEERIYPFRLNAKLALDQRQAMTRLFVHRGNPFAAPLSTCRFEHQGKTFDAPLSWRATPKDGDPWWEKFQAASVGPAAAWGLSEPAPGVSWVGVPTFSSGDDTAPKLDALIKAVSAKAAQMQQAKAIVIDTRGNGGGNSMWADRLAEAIFTPEVLAKYQAPAREAAVDWRASKANASYWRDWSKQMVKEFGAFSVNRLMADFLGWQLERSATNDPPLWREIASSCRTGRSGGLTKQRPKGESPFPARVYFLSNGSCGSSCLNFADRVLMVPGVKVIGSATSGDGLYMEVREEKLPSGLSLIAFPQKVERGGGRGSLEAYEADIAYDGSWSDEAVRAWVMETVTR